MLYAKHLSSTEHTLLVQVVTTLNELFQRRDAMVIDQVHCVRTKVWPFTFFPFSLPPLRLLFLFLFVFFLFVFVVFYDVYYDDEDEDEYEYEDEDEDEDENEDEDDDEDEEEEEK